VHYSFSYTLPVSQHRFDLKTPYRFLPLSSRPPPIRSITQLATAGTDPGRSRFPPLLLRLTFTNPLQSDFRNALLYSSQPMSSTTTQATRSSKGRLGRCVVCAEVETIQGCRECRTVGTKLYICSKEHQLLVRLFVLLSEGTD